jgi:hypothetical protein
VRSFYESLRSGGLQQREGHDSFLGAALELQRLHLAVVKEHTEARGAKLLSFEAQYDAYSMPCHRLSYFTPFCPILHRFVLRLSRGRLARNGPTRITEVREDEAGDQAVATTSKSGSNTSIIAMLSPRRHIFRDWTPQPFSVYEDVELTGSRKGDHNQKNSQGTRPPSACDPICKRSARNYDAQILVDTWARRTDSPVWRRGGFE